MTRARDGRDVVKRGCLRRAVADYGTHTRIVAPPPSSWSARTSGARPVGVATWFSGNVRDEDMGYGVEISNFEWKDKKDGGMLCAVVESHEGTVCESYSVFDLPEMVIAAESEQPAGVVLVYDRQQVDEFELLGDEEAKEMERMIPDEEESEDEPEEDEL